LKQQLHRYWLCWIPQESIDFLYAGIFPQSGFTCLLLSWIRVCLAFLIDDYVIDLLRYGGLKDSSLLTIRYWNEGQKWLLAVGCSPPALKIWSDAHQVCTSYLQFGFVSLHGRVGLCVVYTDLFRIEFCGPEPCLSVLFFLILFFTRLSNEADIKIKTSILLSW